MIIKFILILPTKSWYFFARFVSMTVTVLCCRITKTAGELGEPIFDGISCFGLSKDWGEFFDILPVGNSNYR